MLQRIQTVYFLMAFIFVSTSLIGNTLFTYTLNEIEFYVTAYGIENSLKPTIDSKIYYLPILTISLLLLSIIFSFKNRKRQISLSWLALVLNLVTGSWIVYSCISVTMCSNCNSTNPVPSVGFYLFQSAFIFILLGILGVRKDKKMVDSLNRLR
jgi:hypothetical protein